MRTFTRAMYGLIAPATALTKFVWKTIDLYGSALTRAINPFMGLGCSEIIGIPLLTCPVGSARPTLYHKRAYPLSRKGK